MDDLISRLSEIRSNYNCFDETEEPYYRALSEAIQLASAQLERTGRKMTNAEAIETLIANYPDACFEQLREAVDAAIEALKAQPTLYGYDIKHLMLISEILKKENLPPERVADALADIERIVTIVRDEFEETLRESVNQFKI